jgi:uncharacterized protein YciI
MAHFVVRLARGGPWEWSRDMREQADFDEHARYMDQLVEEGFILLGGPLEGDREVLEIVEAESEEAVRTRWGDDVWVQKGMLTVTSIERWSLLLDGRDVPPH